MAQDIRGWYISGTLRKQFPNLSLQLISSLSSYSLLATAMLFSMLSLPFLCPLPYSISAPSDRRAEEISSPNLCTMNNGLGNVFARVQLVRPTQKCFRRVCLMILPLILFR